MDFSNPFFIASNNNEEYRGGIGNSAIFLPSSVKLYSGSKAYN